MFGYEPSEGAKYTLDYFLKKNETFSTRNKVNLLELGAGLGRDTIYFAKNNIKVHALDFSPCAIDTINKKSKKLGSDKFITTVLCWYVPTYARVQL